MLKPSGYKVLSVFIQEYSLLVESQPCVLSIRLVSTSSKKLLLSSCKKWIYKNFCLEFNIFPITTLSLSCFHFIITYYNLKCRSGIYHYSRSIFSQFSSNTIELSFYKLYIKISHSLHNLYFSHVDAVWI